MAVFFFNLLKSFVQLAYFCKRSEDDYNWIVFSFFFPCYFGSKGQRKRKTYNFCLAITSNYFLYITSQSFLSSHLQKGLETNLNSNWLDFQDSSTFLNHYTLFPVSVGINRHLINFQWKELKKISCSHLHHSQSIDSMECLSIFLHDLSCLCILGVRTLFFSAMLLSLLIYKVQLAKLCGITQHIVPVVRRKKLGSTGLMLSGSSKFFDLHPTVWSHEVTIAFKTVTI